jgi:hypothetical protein
MIKIRPVEKPKPVEKRQLKAHQQMAVGGSPAPLFRRTGRPAEVSPCSQRPHRPEADQTSFTALRRTATTAMHRQYPVVRPDLTLTRGEEFAERMAPPGRPRRCPPALAVSAARLRSLRAVHGHVQNALLHNDPTGQAVRSRAGLHGVRPGRSVSSISGERSAARSCQPRAVVERSDFDPSRKPDWEDLAASARR